MMMLRESGCHSSWLCEHCTLYVIISGEKLTDDEVDTLLSGVEDSQGQVNYEGWSILDT